MSAPCPQEFREDVVRVAHSREDGITIALIAKDFGIHEMTAHNWIRKADTDNGNRPGRTREKQLSYARPAAESDCSNRRTSSCAALPYTSPRRTCRERLYTLASEFAADGIPVAVSLRVLKLSRQSYYLCWK